LFLSLLPSWRRPFAEAFFLRVVGELGFQYIAVERALLVEQGRRGRAGRAVVAIGASIDIGMPSSLSVQQIADQRRAICAFSVDLAPSATDSPPKVFSTR
jgi:hypothetical protein